MFPPTPEGRHAEPTALELVVLACDGAERALEAATHAASPALRATQVSQAIDCIGFLLVTLDYAAGGEMARNLARVYRGLLARLIMASPRRDTVQIEEARHLLKPLAQAWRRLREGHRPLSATTDMVRRAVMPASPSLVVPT